MEDRGLQNFTYMGCLEQGPHESITSRDILSEHPIDFRCCHFWLESYITVGGGWQPWWRSVNIALSHMPECKF